MLTQRCETSHYPISLNWSKYDDSFTTTHEMLAHRQPRRRRRIVTGQSHQKKLFFTKWQKCQITCVSTCCQSAHGKISLRARAFVSRWRRQSSQFQVFKIIFVILIWSDFFCVCVCVKYVPWWFNDGFWWCTVNSS